MTGLVLYWNFDPIAFSIGPLAIRWYGLCWAAAFLICEAMASRQLRALGYSRIDVPRLTVYAIAGTVIGARLMHVLAYDPDYYVSNPLQILAIWRGGLASHGGAIGLVLSLAWAQRRFARDVPLLAITDAVAIPAAIGGALIRIANFLNSEVVGLPTHAAWGVVFESIDMLPRYPVQLFEAVAYLLIAAGLWLYRRHGKTWSRAGRMSGLFFIAVFAARLLLEVWKTPQAAYEAGFLVTTGQWLSLPFIALGAFLVWRSHQNG